MTHAKVTRVSGSLESSDIDKKKSDMEVPNIKLTSPELIESAYEKVKKYDLIFYTNLSKIRTKNFDRFVKDLEKWINDYDQEKINIERAVYKKNFQLLNETLESLSKKYKEENDKEKRTEIEEQIKDKINNLFSLSIAIENLSLRIKKKEIMKMETSIFEKQNNKINFEKNLIKKYLPDLE